ncbi:MAG: hypothetical protein ACN6ON_03850 [Sphingobacterium sp.]
MIRVTFLGGMLFLCLACGSQGGKDKFNKVDSLAGLNAFITKDSLDMLSHRANKDKQIWINRELGDYLLGKDSVLADHSPMTLTIDEKGAFLRYRYEGTVSYFPFKLGMKDFNYQDMTLTTVADSVIGLKMKNGAHFTFIRRQENENGMPDISKYLSRNLLPAGSFDRMITGDNKEAAEVICVEKSWSDATYCRCDSAFFKYKLGYEYPVQTVSGMSKPVYYIRISDRQGSENTYKLDRQENKTLLRDLNSGQVKYTLYAGKNGD